MPRSKIVDRSPIEVLLDNCRRDIRLARDGRRISESFRNTPHRCTDRSLLLAFRLRKSLLRGALREIDRREQRAASGAEVLPAELVPEIDLHVVVQPLVREVVGVALPFVLEHARALDLEQALHRLGEVRIHDL